ncbi:MAG: tripartite tricarboxylate transporter permease [Candidatus Nanoarchaeia archaeon]
MFDLIFALFLGCLAGIFTGLAPGIHTNTIAAILLSYLPYLITKFSAVSLGSFLIAMVIMHSFIDFIPSIFLGAPDEGETALSILPGHKLLLEGKGYEALKCTIVGGIISTLLSLAILPLFCLAIYFGYEKIKPLIPIIILFFSSLFILKEKSGKKKIWALLIFLFSGLLGILALNELSVKEPLFPLLTGLFGIPTLILSMISTGKIAKQKLTNNITFKHNWLNGVKASCCAAVMSVLPALGAAQATVLANYFSKKASPEDFLSIVGGINTASAYFVLATLWLINRARTGVLAAMSQFIQIGNREFFLFILVSLISTALAVIITLQLGKFFSRQVSKIKYRKFSLIVLICLALLVFIFSGGLGLLVCLVATAIGLLAPKAGVKRIHAMGCLAIPVMLYFI